MKRWLMILPLLVACELDGPDTTPVTGDASTPSVDTQTPVPRAEATDDPAFAKIAARLPDGFAGTGALVGRDNVPKGAPDWAGVQAEIVEADGKRWLRSTGLVKGVRNASLARNSAGNRARAELSAWLGSERLMQTEIFELWNDPAAGVTVARARVEVGPDWQPGMKLIQP